MKQMQGAGRFFQRLNPLTGEVASRALAMAPAAAQEVANCAGAAFHAWSTLGPNARRARWGLRAQVQPTGTCWSCHTGHALLRQLHTAASAAG